MKSNKLAYRVLLFTFLIFAFGCQDPDKDPNKVTDFDGNIYSTIKIGDQLWMGENLRSTHFNDGTAIPLVTDPTSWTDLSSPGYCWYDNDGSNKEIYGALYNAYTIDSGKLCPAGWHVPSKEEWQQLITFLGDTLIVGGKLKEAGTDHWSQPNTGADNSSGFGATGAGVRYFEGSFASIFDYSAIWSATGTGSNNQWYMGLYYANSTVTLDHRRKTYGFSVRCIMD
jgi:uncharacterized protein (TIGR02145 family)